MVCSLLHAGMELPGLTFELGEGQVMCFTPVPSVTLFSYCIDAQKCDFKKHQSSYDRLFLFLLCCSEVILHVFHCISQCKNARHEKTLNRC